MNKIIGTTKKKTYSEFPLALILVFFILGIVTEDILNIWAVFWISFSCALICIFKRKSIFLLITICLLIGGIRYYSYRLVPSDNINNFKQINFISGTVYSDPIIKEYRQDMLMKVNKVYTDNGVFKASGDILLSISKNIKTINYKDNIYINGKLEAIHSPTNPSEFNYTKYLARKNIYSKVYINKAYNIKIIDQKHHIFEVTGYILDFKHYIKDLLEKNFYTDIAALSAGMILGDSSYLNKKLQEDVIKTGTLHLMAASGFNCFILAMMSQVIFFFIPYRYRGIITIAAVWAYAFLVGFSASIVRAALMTTLAVSGIIFLRFTNYRHILLLSALIILTVNPSFIFDAGFQLSYCCIFGLLYLMPGISFFNNKITMKISKSRVGFLGLPYNIITTAYIASLCCSIMVFPFAVYYFNYFSFTSVLASVPIAMFATLLLILGIIYSILNNILIMGDITVMLINLIGRWTLDILSYFSQLSVDFNIARFHLTFTIVWYIIIFVLIYFLDRKIYKDQVIL